MTPFSIAVLLELFIIRYNNKYSRSDLLLFKQSLLSLIREDKMVVFPQINISDFVTMRPQEFRILQHFMKYVDKNFKI